LNASVVRTAVAPLYGLLGDEAVHKALGEEAPPEEGGRKSRGEAFSQILTFGDSCCIL
jgi:hypothetical protein